MKIKKIKLKKIKIWKIIFLIVLFIAIISVIAIIITRPFLVLEKKVIYSKVIVSDHYGFDINDTALIFGMTYPGGGSSSKEVILKNEYKSDVRVDIYNYGNISKFLSVEKNSFYLSPNETRKIVFSVAIPSNTSYGTYEGSVVISITRA